MKIEWPTSLESALVESKRWGLRPQFPHLLNEGVIIESVQALVFTAVNSRLWNPKRLKFKGLLGENFPEEMPLGIHGHHTSRRKCIEGIVSHKKEDCGAWEIPKRFSDMSAHIAFFFFFFKCRVEVFG